MKIRLTELEIQTDEEFAVYLRHYRGVKALNDGRRVSRDERDAERVLYKAVRVYFMTHLLRLTPQYPEFAGEVLPNRQTAEDSAK